MAENPNGPLIVDLPRKRKGPPPPPGGHKAKTPYYIEAEPMALGRKTKPLPKRIKVEEEHKVPEG